MEGQSSGNPYGRPELCFVTSRSKCLDTSHHELLLLIYVDDILIFTKLPKRIPNVLTQLWELKPESVKELDFYLRTSVEKIQLSNGTTEWCMPASQSYVKNVVKVVEALMAKMRPRC